MRVLVTGGAGFIGRTLVKMLLAKGHSVVILDNSPVAVSGFSGLLQSEDSSKYIKGDIRDTGLVSLAVRGCEAVVHLAAIVSVPFSVEQPLETCDVNVRGTLNLLNQCARQGVPKFIFASSCAVYGEAQYLPIDEKHPKSPLSPYAASKLAAEVYCSAFSRSDHLSITVLRFFNIFGPGQSVGSYSGVISRFAAAMRNSEPLVIHGDGTQSRDFVHIKDVTSSIVRCLVNEQKWPAEDCMIYNIGSGRSVSVLELVRIMQKILGVEVQTEFAPPRVGDVKHSQADIRKANDELGYMPTVTIEEGLRELLVNRESTV